MNLSNNLLSKYLWLFDKVTTDYLGVKERIQDLKQKRGRLGFHIPNIDTAKPYTIVASYLLNKFGVSYDRRVSCETAIELLLRPITAMDDILDSSWYGIDRQFEWSPMVTFKDTTSDEINFGYLGLNPLFVSTNGILFIANEEDKGILQRGSASLIKSEFVRRVGRILEGYKWQYENRIRKIDDIVKKKDFPSAESVLESYVDKIAGDLFALGIEIMRNYVPEKDEKLAVITELMYPFGEIFQVPDDIMDIQDDTQRLQITSANSEVLNNGYPEERIKLKRIAESKSRVKDAYKLFPSLALLDDVLEPQKEKLIAGLKSIELEDAMNYLAVFTPKNYQRMRKMIDAKII